MTLSTHRKRDLATCRLARVYLDGVEVTKRTFYVDIRRGVVRMYALNDQGRMFIDSSTGRVAQEERRGHVHLSIKWP